MSRDLYAEITGRIVHDLENGVAPWDKPWKENGTFVGMPRNAATKKPYRGINILLLWCAAEDNCWTDLRFLTFNQARELGGSIRKGEHGAKIYFYKPLEIKDKETDKIKKIPLLREYTVFNVAQTENCGFEETEAPIVASLPVDTQELINALETKVNHGGDWAFYSPATDQIGMPLVSQFPDLNAYRSVLYHELTHWTGHKSRLDREFKPNYEAHEYAREELVAELGAAFMCAEFGLPYETRHAAYLDHYLGILKADSRAIVQAANMAQKAVDHMRELVIGETETAMAA